MYYALINRGFYIKVDIQTYKDLQIFFMDNLTEININNQAVQLYLEDDEIANINEIGRRTNRIEMQRLRARETIVSLIAILFDIKEATARTYIAAKRRRLIDGEARHVLAWHFNSGSIIQSDDKEKEAGSDWIAKCATIPEISSIKRHYLVPKHS